MTAHPSYPLFDPTDPVFWAHEGGKLGVHATQPLRDRADLSLLYTPGVADVSRAIAADPSLAARYTAKRHTVAVVTDGTAVLGLGDIGPLAALPVMEGKAVLFKHFAGIDAVPVCMETGTVDELVDAIARIAPTYGGINLEDISAPRCFEIERRLQERLDIPIFHDDQHGTAIVVLAGLINAAKVVGGRLRCRCGRRRGDEAARPERLEHDSLWSEESWKVVMDVEIARPRVVDVVDGVLEEVLSRVLQSVRAAFFEAWPPAARFQSHPQALHTAGLTQEVNVAG